MPPQSACAPPGTRTSPLARQATRPMRACVASAPISTPPRRPWRGWRSGSPSSRRSSRTSRSSGADPEPSTLGRLAELQEAADRARAERDELARRRDAAREAWNATRGEAEGLETRVAGRRQQRSVREARVAQLSAGLPDRRAGVERLAAERADLATAAVAARDADAEASAAQERAESERSARRTELLELEGDQGGGGARLGELEREAQATAIEASRRDEALAALARERELALDGLPETTAEAPRDEIEALDDSALEQEVRRVRRTLAQIGSVNPFAVEEHREVAARLEEMSGQDADLRGAIESTEELIATLDARDRGAVRRRLPAPSARSSTSSAACSLPAARRPSSGRTRPMATRRAASRSSSGRPASGCSASRCSRAASER